MRVISLIIKLCYKDTMLKTSFCTWIDKLTKKKFKDLDIHIYADTYTHMCVYMFVYIYMTIRYIKKHELV